LVTPYIFLIQSKIIDLHLNLSKLFWLLSSRRRTNTSL